MADGENQNQTYSSIAEAAEGLRKNREAAAKAPAPKAEVAPEPEIEDKAPAPVDAPQTEEIEVADPAAETLDGEPDEANSDGDDGDEGEPEVPAIAPPQFWDAKQKELFAKLPKEAQETVLSLEKQRDAFVSRKANEAAQVARAAQAKQEQLSQHIEKLSGFVSEVETELTEYGKIDWAQEIADATTADEIKNVQWHQARFEKLKQQKDAAARAQQEAEQTEFQDFHRARVATLKKIAPDLDPDKPEGIQRIQLLERFMAANNIDPQTQMWVPAEGMAIVYDALRWRQQEARQRATPAAQTPKPPAGPTVRPASSASGSPNNQRLSQLTAKKNLSIEEGKELLALKRKSKR